jgi:chromosome condensin MukBEF complex kleisin-like MukF subunit
VTLPSEVQQRTKDVREAAQILVVRNQQAINRSDVLIREAEAHLLERQQALRAAMRRRP